MRLFNDSSLDLLLPETPIPSGRPTPSVDPAEVDWAGVGGGSLGGLVFFVVVVVLVARRHSERVREILERVSTLLAACTALIRRQQAPDLTPPTPAPSAAPHGRNFTDSFLVQWNARVQQARVQHTVQEARSVYV